MSRAFLVGAGATKAQYQNSPLSDDFFLLLDNKEHPLYQHISDTISKHLNLGPNPLNKLNIEEVMIASEIFPPAIKTSFQDTVMTAIYSLLAKETKSTENDMDKALNETVLDKPTIFNTLLRQEQLNQSDFFMTLNYDLFLDREILSLTKCIDYGIDDRFLATPSALALSRDNTFSVYHLHGALNWLWHQDRISIKKGAVIPHARIKGYNLCLIPPGKKDIPIFLKSIWSVAKNRLMAADELIIIGCSLNPADNELIDLIKDFAIKRGDECIKVIYLDKSFDPSIETIHDDYSKILGPNIKRYNHGFDLKSPDPRSGKLGAIEFILTPCSQIKTSKHPDH